MREARPIDRLEVHMNANQATASYKKASRRRGTAPRRAAALRADVAAFEAWQRQTRRERITLPRR
jgi:class 3 adenylate cyclase